PVASPGTSGPSPGSSSVVVRNGSFATAPLRLAAPGAVPRVSVDRPPPAGTTPAGRGTTRAGHGRSWPGAGRTRARRGAALGWRTAPAGGAAVGSAAVDRLVRGVVRLGVVLPAAREPCDDAHRAGVERRRPGVERLVRVGVGRDLPERALAERRDEPQRHGLV